MLSFNKVVSKWLQIEKRKIFSYNHVNKKHEVVDWTIRIIFIVLLIIGFAFHVVYYPHDTTWNNEIILISILFHIVSEMAQAIMEWKHKENKNEAIFTISRLVFTILLFGSFFLTNGWGFID